MFIFTMRFVVFSLICLCGPILAIAQDSISKKGEYLHIIVETFDNSGTEFPDTTLKVMTAEIVEELTKIKKFKSVSLAANSMTEVDVTPVEKISNSNQIESLQPPPTSVLKLVGTISKFEKGNRTKRYLIGFGAGKTKVVAHIKFIDSAGTVIYEKDVDGSVVIGFFGGSSNNATRGLAKEIAKTAKKRFF